MSSKLKKKNKSMGITNREVNHARKYSRQHLNENNMIRDSFRRLSLIGCYIIHDEFGFAEKRIKKFVGSINGVLDKWYSNEFSTQLLMTYAEKKKVDYKTWITKVPTSYKLRIANAKTNHTNALDVGKTLDSAFVLFGLLSIVVLKEEFKLSNAQIGLFFERLIDCCDSYCRKDYGNETYLSDKRVQETILEECRFNICDLVFVP